MDNKTICFFLSKTLFADIEQNNLIGNNKLCLDTNKSVYL